MAKVEVDTGDGWAPTEVIYDPVAIGVGPFLWTLWSTTWTPDRAGEVVVQVRATDVDGVTQDAEADFPYDGSAIHRVRSPGPCA